MLIFSYVVNLLGSAFFLQCGPVRILSKTTHDKSSKTSYRKLKLNGYFRKCMVISLLLLLTLSDFIFSVGGTLFSNTVELLVPLSGHFRTAAMCTITSIIKCLHIQVHLFRSKLNVLLVPLAGHLTLQEL